MERLLDSVLCMAPERMLRRRSLYENILDQKDPFVVTLAG